MALIFRHVKTTPYHLSVALPRFTSKGPKKSTPTLANGGSPGVTLSFGKSAMNCSPLMAPVFLQETHLVRTFRMAEIAPGIQYFCLKRECMTSATVSKVFMNVSDNELSYVMVLWQDNWVLGF